MSANNTIKDLIIGLSDFIANGQIVSLNFGNINQGEEYFIKINEGSIYLYIDTKTGYTCVTLRTRVVAQKLSMAEILNWLKVCFKFNLANYPYKIDSDSELTKDEINEIDDRLFELWQCYDDNTYDHNREHIFTDILGLDKVMAKIHEYDSSHTKLKLSSGRELYLCFAFGD